MGRECRPAKTVVSSPGPGKEALEALSAARPDIMDKTWVFPNVEVRSNFLSVRRRTAGLMRLSRFFLPT